MGGAFRAVTVSDKSNQGFHVGSYLLLGPPPIAHIFPVQYKLFHLVKQFLSPVSRFCQHPGRREAAYKSSFSLGIVCSSRSLLEDFPLLLSGLEIFELELSINNLDVTHWVDGAFHMSDRIGLKPSCEGKRLEQGNRQQLLVGTY